MKTLVIGSRGSQLALWQARYVGDRIAAFHPQTDVKIRVIRTTGDKLTDVALAKMGGKGVFVKEIEEALLDRRIDLAVHSLKDVPTELPEGLSLGTVLAREDPRDTLVGPRKIDSLDDLPARSRIGTGSLRRTVQLRQIRPDLMLEPIRGNVDTRIRKVREDDFDGVVLARAGLNRLGLADRIAYVFPVSEMIPASGQGALAVEVRRQDRGTQRLLEPLEDPETRICVEWEREFLQRMGGGCQVPMGAYARHQDGQAVFTAFVASPSGDRLLRKETRGPWDEIGGVCRQAIDFLLAEGAEELVGEWEEPS